jgi:hypothetical protein
MKMSNKNTVINGKMGSQLLNACPDKGMNVNLEGCDCYGEADRVEIDHKDGTILIGRWD